eukprot:s50_g45.t1
MHREVPQCWTMNSVFAWCMRLEGFMSHHALRLSSQYQLSQKLCVWSLLLPSVAKSWSQKDREHADTAGDGKNDPPKVGDQQQRIPSCTYIQKL